MTIQKDNLEFIPSWACDFLRNELLTRFSVSCMKSIPLNASYPIMKQFIVSKLSCLWCTIQQECWYYNMKCLALGKTTDVVLLQQLTYYFCHHVGLPRKRACIITLRLILLCLKMIDTMISNVILHQVTVSLLDQWQHVRLFWVPAGQISCQQVPHA